MRCPKCNHEFEVENAAEANALNCPACGQSIAVVEADAPPVAAQVVQATPAAPKSSNTCLIIGIVLAVIGALSIPVIAILVALLLPAVNAAREAARRNQCINHVRQITIAMQMYEEDHGTLPPAYVADENGKPMHSWRVLLLPYLEEQRLYDQYDMDKPWDSPENLAVTQQMPAIYACPSSVAGDSQTHYMVIVGADTAFPGSQGIASQDIEDGLGTTLLIVESANSVHWSEPIDVDAATTDFQINGSSGSGIGSHHTGGAVASFADGSTRYLSNESPGAVQAMSTRAGGEQVQFQ